MAKVAEKPIKIKPMSKVNKKTYEHLLKEYTGDGNIYCECMFEFKDTLKRLGFRWNSKMKLWFISKRKFTYHVYMESQVFRCQTLVHDGGVLNFYYVKYVKLENVSDVNKNNCTLDDFFKSKSK